MQIPRDEHGHFIKGHGYIGGGSKKGTIPWIKGKKHTEETRRKLSESHIGKTGYWAGKKKGFAPKTAFKKGEKHTENWYKVMQGRIPWNKGIEMPSGEDSPSWKGDKVGKSQLHRWVAKHLGKPMQCSLCGTTERQWYDWANKSGEYKRDLDDWIRLCRSCHRIYDKSTGKHKRNELGRFA